MAKTGFYSLAVIAVTLGVAYATTEAEVAAIRAAIRPMLEECGKEFGVTRENIFAARAAGELDKFDPCFYACFFKKVGYIDANGLFNYKVAIENNNKYFKGEEDVKKTARIGETCAAVNDQAVTDGDKACERSQILMTCFLKENAIDLFTPFSA